jgi:hypothetical protein
MLNQIGYVRFAQVGWYEWSLNCRKVFLQYWNGTGYPLIEYGPNPDNTYTNYKVTYSGTQFSFYSGSTLLKTVSAAFNPNEGEIAGEIKNELNQMPGDYGIADWMQFQNMQKRLEGSTAWSTYSPTSVGTSNNAKWYAVVSGSTLFIADKRGDCS